MRAAGRMVKRERRPERLKPAEIFSTPRGFSKAAISPQGDLTRMESRGVFFSLLGERRIERDMSGIPAQFRRFLQRLNLGQVALLSSEIAPADLLPLPALGDFASAAVPSVALCARCRRALRRNGHKVRAGRARARVALRDERGRFVAGART